MGPELHWLLVLVAKTTAGTAWQQWGTAPWGSQMDLFETCADLDASQLAQEEQHMLRQDCAPSRMARKFGHAEAGLARLDGIL